MTRAPEFLIMTDAECREVLDRNHVGRLAFLRDRAVDIEPIGYVFDDQWIFARSGYGAKLEAIAHHPYVAFEVDEIRGPFDWRSVVAHGTIYRLTGEGSEPHRDGYRRAIAALRRIMPGAFTARDPVPTRDIVYGLYIHQLDGRMARASDRSDGKGQRAPVHVEPRRASTEGT